MNTAPERLSDPGDVARLLRDCAFRRRVRQLEPDALASLGYLTDPADLANLGATDAPAFKVVTSTRDKMYVQMPARPSDGAIPPEGLAQIHAAGGNTAGSASSVGSTGTASTLGTVCSTASSSTSLSSIGSAGSAGSAG